MLHLLSLFLFRVQSVYQLPVVADDSEFLAKGIPAEWIPIIRKTGITTIDELKQANPNKLFNDLCGFRKKLKLEIAAPSADDVKKWVE